MRFTGEFSEEGSWNAVSAGRVRLLTFSKTVGGGTEKPTGCCWGQLVPCLPPRDREKETESLGLSVRDCCGLSGAPSRARPPSHPPMRLFLFSSIRGSFVHHQGPHVQMEMGQKAHLSKLSLYPSKCMSAALGVGAQSRSCGGSSPVGCSWGSRQWGPEAGPSRMPSPGQGPWLPSSQGKRGTDQHPVETAGSGLHPRHRKWVFKPVSKVSCLPVCSQGHQSCETRSCESSPAQL